MMNSPILNPFQAIDDAEGEIDPLIRSQLLEQAISALSAPDTAHTAETHYALGYAWYLHPQEAAIRDSKVTWHLQKALEIDPGHRFARLYLGHYYYDRRRFADALAALSSLEDDEFAALGQVWRDAKVAELLLCCMLQLGDRSRIQETVFHFCDSLTKCEDGMHANPDELTATLVEKLTGATG